MVTKVDAVFDGDVLRPDDALPLAPNTRVRITIEVVASPATRDSWEQTLLSAAKDCGVSLPNAALSREELYE